MGFWTDKSIVVTGGSAGLGLALSRAFVSCGAKLTIVARDKSRLDSAVASLRQHYPDVQIAIHSADVCVSDEAQQAIQSVVERHGRIDGLVNCVGASTRCDLIHATPDLFRIQLEVNFMSAVNCTQASLPHLIRQRGCIINVNSLAGKTAWPFMAPYSASKSALLAYSNQLRLELNGQLQVLSVCSGPIRSEVAGNRYATESQGLPTQAKLPGAGAPIKGIDPDLLANKILRACERGKFELIVPRSARLLFVAAAISPRFGDWLLRRFTNKTGNAPSPD